MIQDIAPHKLNNHFVSGKRPAPDSTTICFQDRKVLLRMTEDDTASLPVYTDFPSGTKAIYLFTFDEKDVFLALTRFDRSGGTNPDDDEPEDGLPEGCRFEGVRTIRMGKLLEKQDIFLLMTAVQLANWYNDNRYCGRCARPTVHSPKERALYCEHCNRTIYPRILPAVIVAVLHDGKVLLTQYAGRANVPYYALVAGFTEIGETLEECVAREVKEETGLSIKNIRYYKSQPWGIVDDLLMGFFCEVDGDPTIHMDTEELKTAVWCTPEEIALQPDALSLTNEMMMLVKSGNVSSPSDLPLSLARADIKKLEEQYYA